AVLGGLDLLVFTAGVGEHNAFVRERVCRDLAFLGLALDQGANAADAPIIASDASRVRVGVEPTNEDWVAARAALRALACPGRGTAAKDVPDAARTRRLDLEDAAGGAAGPGAGGGPAQPAAAPPRRRRRGLERRAGAVPGRHQRAADHPRQGAPVNGDPCRE